MSKAATTYLSSRKSVPTSKSRRRPAKRSKRDASPAPSLRFTKWGFRETLPADPLPGWKALSTGKTSKKQPGAFKKSASRIDQISTRQFALGILVAAVLLGAYVSHVFATQETLARRDALERDNLRLSLEYDQKKASFDRLVNPTDVYRRATEMGLSAGTDYGPTIEWESPVRD